MMMMMMMIWLQWGRRQHATDSVWSSWSRQTVRQ